jgi:RNA polymerase sigma factor (TIGR02999 family)
VVAPSARAIEVTALLADVAGGEASALDALFRHVYDELRELADHRMRHEPAGHTLQPTALVHEAWLRLVGDQAPNFESRAHFFACAATAMRRILIERARRVRRVRHGGEMARAHETVEVAEESGDPVDLVALDSALDELERRDRTMATLVTLRFLVGCTIEEAATALSISPAKVKKDWAFARAWLRRRLQDDNDDDHG